MTRQMRKGMVRVIEAAFAAILLIMAFQASYFMLFSSKRPYLQETVDLNLLAYNTLHRIVESGYIDQCLIEDCRPMLFEALESMLPFNVYFNLTIYVWDSSSPSWIPINGIDGKSYISNAPEGVFEATYEVTVAHIPYTSKGGRIFYLILTLTRGGLV